MYDYLIVGAGLYGAAFAQQVSQKGKKCLVIDRRDHIGGNTYNEEIVGITVHKYGPHIFHTDNKKVWNYIRQFAEFNNFINSPIANYKGELYNLPFNMNTFNKLWGVRTPQEAKEKIAEQRKLVGVKVPANLEEQALSLVGFDIYEKIIKGYTEKQWGRSCDELPAFIIKRIPLRFTFNNNYFTDRYQGIPADGYNGIVEKMLARSDLQLNTDFLAGREKFKKIAKKIVYTGMIDEFYNYKFGVLEYRSLKFKTTVLAKDNYQGNAVVNYTDRETPYTRIIEHKHFVSGTQPETVITREYPVEWKAGDEPYYPVNNNKNNELFNKYRDLASKEKNIIFGGRLADYKYYNMDQVIEEALKQAREELAF